jgi:DNA-binding GntR family transcriptional regulator
MLLGRPAVEESTAERDNQNLAAQLVATLKDRIVRWEYPPGFRLTEEALCEEFGVSRSPVRAALTVLAEKRLIDKVPHRSYTVKQPDLQEIDELYAVRLALELYVVEFLAQHEMSGELWQELSQTWQAILEEPHGDNEALSTLDEQFHQALVDATHNKTLAHRLQALNERLYIFRMTDFTAPGRVANTCRQHLEILDRIKAQDPDGARSAVRANIEEARNNIENALKEALVRAYIGRTSRS